MMLDCLGERLACHDAALHCDCAVWFHRKEKKACATTYASVSNDSSCQCEDNDVCYCIAEVVCLQ